MCCLNLILVSIFSPPLLPGFSFIICTSLKFHSCAHPLCHGSEEVRGEKEFDEVLNHAERVWVLPVPASPPQAENLEFLQDSGQRLDIVQSNIHSHFSWQSSQTAFWPFVSQLGIHLQVVFVGGLKNFSLWQRATRSAAHCYCRLPWHLGCFWDWVLAGFKGRNSRTRWEYMCSSALET